jgi:hypothetical protein
MYGTKKLPPTPFLLAAKCFREYLNHDGSGDVLTTNLFRSALYLDGRDDTRSVLNARPAELQQIFDWQRGCLTGEVRVLKPTSVLFLTGHRYDSALFDEFRDATFERVANWNPRQVARVSHERLPSTSFRTYHPGFLRRGKWGWLKELAALLL